jgi:hypothetical protein
MTEPQVRQSVGRLTCYSNARLGCHAFSFLLSFIVVLTTHLIRFVSCLCLVPAQGLWWILIYSDLLYILVLFFVFAFNIYIYIYIYGLV